MRKITAFALASIIWSMPAHAQFIFSPISADLEPAGKAGFTTFTAANRSDNPIAVRVKMLTREVAEDGTERNEPAAKDLFTVYPGQLVLEPGQERAIRVSWKGNATVETELAFRVLAEQVDIDFSDQDARDEEAKASIDIRFRYLGTVYILAKNGKPRIIGEVLRRDGPSADLVLQNTGTAHAIMRNLRVSLSGGTDDNWSVHTIESSRLQGLSGANLLAGGRRVLPIQLPEGFPDGPINVEVYFDYP